MSLPGDPGAAADGVPGLRGGPGRAEVPLPGGGLPYGLECAGCEACLRDAGSKAGDYGRVVRIDLAAHDRRMFTPTPWGSPSWRRGALERINARLDNSFGFERHFVRGRVKMQAHLGLALAVMMALALGSVAAGRPERMRSLVDPGLPLAA